MWATIAVAIGLLGGACVVSLAYFSPRRRDVYVGKHVVVLGGSQGLGRTLAEEFFMMGAKVTIMARTQSKLDTAVEEITALKAPKQAEIQAVSVDVSRFDEMKAAFNKAEQQMQSPVFTLIVSSGGASPGYFLEQDPSVFAKSMDTNYLGPVHAAKVVVPRMLDAGVKGEIVFISSAAAAASFIGYASYAPTKAALRSFSDALRNELCGTGITVHIAYPPDMDTPGFEEENKTKPKETLLVSPPEVYQVKAVSGALIDGLLRKEYHLPSPDIVQNFLVSTTVNITPRGRWALFELLLSPILGLAMLVFKWHADRQAAPYGKRLLKRD